MYLALWLADRPSGVSCTKRIVGLMVMMALWHHVRLSSSWHLLSPGMFWARRRLFLRLTARNRSPASGVCYRNHRRKLSEHRIWIYMVVCSKHSQFFCLHAIHLKQLFSWNTLVQFWFPTENQGRSHMTISLRYKRACFQPLDQQNYDLCVHSVMKYSTIQFKTSTWQWKLL